MIRTHKKASNNIHNKINNGWKETYEGEKYTSKQNVKICRVF